MYVYNFFSLLLASCIIPNRFSACLAGREHYSGGGRFLPIIGVRYRRVRLGRIVVGWEEVRRGEEEKKKKEEEEEDEEGIRVFIFI
jgi:hypothetical protein